MPTQLPGRDDQLVDARALQPTIDRLRDARVVLPTFGQLASPGLDSAPGCARRSSGSAPDDADPLNLFRVHWYNGASRVDTVDVPDHVVLPRELTGVDARIVVALGDRFPLIGAHKVLAAYGCLAPRLVSGQFDPTRQRAVWPSTGNYCRGGVAISRLLGCRGVAVLPEGMSRERFDWLARWVVDPGDIVRTPGTESNVKEIYDTLQGARDRPGQRHPQPVLRVRELPRPLPRDRRCARAGLRVAARARARAPAPRVRRRRRARPGRSPPATT